MRAPTARLFPQRQLRCYAHGPGRTRPWRLGETVSLDHTPGRRVAGSLMRCALCPQFLQRSRVLALYRTVLRGIRRISDHKTRDETRLFVRQEIERHRHHGLLTDRPPLQQHIRYLLSTGKTQWDGFERFIDVIVAVAPTRTLSRPHLLISSSPHLLVAYTSPCPGHNVTRQI
ncbi:complex 1 protein [Diaporthe helianthi]|uniref:LYR motif-containing protein 2 n=1 Tax=Diaporthe helianthi TaxID=158607 RepID=A0A2P5HRU1_DIAHE|nr:complex 1 protein [Diaporthe helianthi]